MTALPPRVDFAERAKADGSAPLNTGDAHAIAAAAREFVLAETKAGREVSFEAAVEHVCRSADQAGTT